MPAADAGPSAPRAEAARRRPWMFVAWGAWLLAWLAPALLLGPRTPDPRPWIEPTSAPAAVLAGAALFLVAAWPFWPALLPDVFSRGGSPHPPRETTVGARFVGLSALEMLVLVALAAPMLLVARSVGQTLHVWPAAATGVGLALFGIGLRTAAASLGSRAARRLMVGALLVSGGPPAVYYAASETIGAVLPWLPAASPVVALVQAGTVGWPEAAWPQIARLYLWPMVGVGLGAVGMLSARRARAAHV